MTTPTGPEMSRTLLAAHAGLRQDLMTLRDALRLLQQQDTAAAAGFRSMVEGMTMRQSAWQLRSFCDFYCQKVNAHHSIEDTRIFPAVLRAAPELASVVAQLEDDHKRLGVLLNALTGAAGTLPGPAAEWAAAREAVENLANHLEIHLEREEKHILPVLARLPAWV